MLNRTLTFARLTKRASKALVPIRNSGHYCGYRELNYDSTRVGQKYGAEIMAGIMWWWIGWNIMTDWRHLIGEYILPNRDEWSDEHLGVPK